MTPAQLTEQIRNKQSFLCVGLDTDIRRIPACLQGADDPVFEFNKRIIEATLPYAIAYKPNIAFYESLGPAGWRSLQKTLELIPPEVMTIADAKRGDIGNTSRLYARTFFETYQFDAITVAPYMGKDSVAPFLEFEDKWVFLLALTSNPGAADFQYHGGSESNPLFRRVLYAGIEWDREFPGHLGFVAGATRAETLTEIRYVAPNAWLLVPGVGEQGGDLGTVIRKGPTSEGGLLINASRSIIYAGSEEDFDERAAQAARLLQEGMRSYFEM
ncbi:MAG: orotidine-5'-phosphate decarboxylase [Bacteroidia bacterium]|nr:orotidine-5'-phosphate decarboxylase [Bacteroidia bacterium]